MTSAMACIASQRPCTILETGKTCVQFARPRLEEFAKAQFYAQLKAFPLNPAVPMNEDVQEYGDGDGDAINANSSSGAPEQICRIRAKKSRSNSRKSDDTPETAPVAHSVNDPPNDGPISIPLRLEISKPKAGK